jgi:hypothetical protein
MANPFDQLGKKIGLGALLPSGPTEEGARPGPPSARPFLWIITAGRPSTVLSSFGAVPAEGWPRGVYASPGEPLAAGERPAGTREPGGLLRVGIVVASELPRDRSTILVRLMAGGAALPAALRDLAALPGGAWERAVASEDVLDLRRVLGKKPDRTTAEEEFIVSTRDALAEWGEELRQEGRREGEAVARARDVLTVLRVRGVAVPDAARDRILAQQDPERLARWFEKAVVATSVAEVLDEPS